MESRVVLEGQRDDLLRWVTALVVVFGVAIVLRNAWVCDDAFITFRTSANLVHGDGLTWNPGERVQAYTNPLWMFAMALAYALTGELYFTAIAAGVVATGAALWLLFRRHAAAPASMLLVLAILLSSKAFVDYATSGLENPAGHLILVGFACVWFSADQRPERRAVLLGLFAALGTLNRLDGILLYAPALAIEAWRVRRSPRLLARMAAGLSPVVAWELFALFYYGFPFPNTYYAKLHNGIERVTLIKVGLAYLLDSLKRDPITFPVIVFAIVGALRSRDRATVGLALGAVLHLLYLVWIGGDHMTGRFLTAPLMIAAIIVVRTPALATRPHALVVAAAVFAFGLLNPYAPALSDSRYGEIARPANEDRPFSDERASYYAAAGLLTWNGRRRIPDHKLVDDALRDVRDGVKVRARGAIGYYGWTVRGRVHVLDWLALADPLLARLPRDPTVRWRPGHARRSLPAGYRESLEVGENRVEHPGLRTYYDHLRRVTRGDLWSWERLSSIWQLNTGQLDYLLVGVPAHTEEPPPPPPPDPDPDPDPVSP